MNKTVEIFSKFPCKLIELNVRLKNQPKFSKNITYEFNYPERLYITKDGGLIFTTISLKRNDILILKNLKLEAIILKDIRYKRTSNDYKGKLFLHNFNGHEKFYTCNLKGYMIYYVSSIKPLWKQGK